MSARVRRRQLDEALKLYANAPLPKRGYIREIRTALQMPNKVLAERLSITPSALTQLELSETRGTISLKTLARAAEALDCEFVYAFVPRKSLVAQVDAKAKQVAAKFLKATTRTMALELQEPTDKETQLLIDELAEELVAKGRVWDDDLV